MPAPVQWDVKCPNGQRILKEGITATVPIGGSGYGARITPPADGVLKCGALGVFGELPRQQGCCNTLRDTFT